MKAVILCGGQGTRIRDVADDVPKPMIRIGDRPILWHIMQLYAASQISDFVLCLGYHPIGATWSLPGIGWMGLGWLGVILLCGFWGYVLGVIYRRFVESDQSTFKVAAYMCFMPILIVAYRDGLILTVLRQSIFYISPVLLWFGIARFFKVPLARDLRVAMARMRRREAAQTKGGGPELTPSAKAAGEVEQSMGGLPPAVRRRRIALARMRGGGEQLT